MWFLIPQRDRDLLVRMVYAAGWGWGAVLSGDWEILTTSLLETPPAAIATGEQAHQGESSLTQRRAFPGLGQARSWGSLSSFELGSH